MPRKQPSTTLRLTNSPPAVSQASVKTWRKVADRNVKLAAKHGADLAGKVPESEGFPQP